MTKGFHTRINVDLLHAPEGYFLGWRNWRGVTGGGLLSFLRWLFSFGSVPSDVAQRLTHDEFVEARICHRYRRSDYCFCPWE